MSTPYAFPDRRLAYAKPLSLVIPRVDKGQPDWHNPEAAKDHVDYPYHPTRAIAELRDLLVVMRQALPKIKVPVLLVHSRQDGGVPPDNMTTIYEHLGSKDKEMLWLDNSGHVVTREPERMRIFQAAQDFIERTNKEIE